MNQNLSAPLMSAGDPFYAVRDALEIEIKQLRIKFDAWQGLLNSVNTASDTNFKVKHEELRANIAKADEQCRKIKTAVINVERKRINFPHIDDRELESRKAFVIGLEQAVAAMRDAFNGRETQGKLEADQRRELHSRAAVEANAEASRQNVYNMANRDFLTDQRQQQEQIRRTQDQSLDKMSDSLTVLNHMAQEINSELQTQDKMLEDVDKNMDVVQGRMDAAIKGVEKLLKTKNRCQLATIAGLVIILVIVAIIALS